MTTRPHLGDNPSYAPSQPVRASAALIASLSRLGMAPSIIPVRPAPLVTDDNGDIVEPPPLPADQQAAVARYPVRHTAVLVNRNATPFRAVSALDRARLWSTAVDMEAKTKSKGAAAGCFGASGLLVLNALLFRFANTESGRCDPSYSALQAVTGFCRQTIADAINRLAASGIVNVTRRWLRFRDPASGQMTARQITNAYSFAEASRRLFAIPSPLRARGPIPRRGANDPSGNLARILKMSLFGRQELKQPAKTVPNFDPRNPPDVPGTTPTPTGTAGD